MANRFYLSHLKVVQLWDKLKSNGSFLIRTCNIFIIYDITNDANLAIMINDRNILFS